MTCAQGLLRLLWGGPKLECYGTDSDDLVWRRRWFDSTSAATRTFNLGQRVVMVRDTSSLNLETATIHCLVTLRVHLQCKGNVNL